MRVCLDVDAGWWALGGRVKVGAKRSPVHTPAQAAALAREVVSRPRLELDGLMAYESQIAGVGDRPPGRPLMGLAVRALQRASSARARRTARGGGGRGARGRAASVRQRRRHREHRAHGGRARRDRGGGRLGPLRARPSSTPTAPSAPRPAALFALPVVRRPGPGVVTALGGGYPASGAAGPRSASPSLPAARPAPRPHRGGGRGPDAAARRRPPTACGSATACGCATPRPASCASASTRLLRARRATGSSTSCRPTAARDRPSSSRPRRTRPPARARGRCRRSRSGPRVELARGRPGSGPSRDSGGAASPRSGSGACPSAGRPPSSSMISSTAAEVGLVGHALEDVHRDIAGLATAGRAEVGVVGCDEAHLDREAHRQPAVAHQGAHARAPPRRWPPGAARTPSPRSGPAAGWRRSGGCGRRARARRAASRSGG